jgi:hypothetical protein
MGLKKGFFSASPSAAKAAAHPPNSVALATNPSSTAPTAGTTPTSSATHMGLKRGFFSKIQTLGLSSPSTSQQQSAVSSDQDFKSLSAQFAALAPSSTTDNYPQYIAIEYESDSEISLDSSEISFSERSRTPYPSVHGRSRRQRTKRLMKARCNLTPTDSSTIRIRTNLHYPDCLVHAMDVLSQSSPVTVRVACKPVRSLTSGAAHRRAAKTLSRQLNNLKNAARAHSGRKFRSLSQNSTTNSTLWQTGISHLLQSSSATAPCTYVAHDRRLKQVSTLWSLRAHSREPGLSSKLTQLLEPCASGLPPRSPEVIVSAQQISLVHLTSLHVKILSHKAKFIRRRRYSCRRHYPCVRTPLDRTYSMLNTIIAPPPNEIIVRHSSNSSRLNHALILMLPPHALAGFG